MRTILFFASIIFIHIPLIAQQNNFVIDSEKVVIDNDTILHISNIDKTGNVIRWTQSSNSNNHSFILHITEDSIIENSSTGLYSRTYYLEEKPYRSIFYLNPFEKGYKATLVTERPEGDEIYEFIVSTITFK